MSQGRQIDKFLNSQRTSKKGRERVLQIRRIIVTPQLTTRHMHTKPFTLPMQHTALAAHAPSQDPYSTQTMQHMLLQGLREAMYNAVA